MNRNNLPEPAETWAVAADGKKYWGKFGAAGTLIVSPAGRMLMQLRAEWTHQGGTWGIPGGAVLSRENAVTGALRELREEVQMPDVQLTPTSTWILDRGGWTYTTVVLQAQEEFFATPADSESDEIRWLKPTDLSRLPLHSGFVRSWTDIAQNLHWKPTLVTPTPTPKEVTALTSGIDAHKIGLAGSRWFPRTLGLEEALLRRRTLGEPTIWVGQANAQYERLLAVSAAPLLRFNTLADLQ